MLKSACSIYIEAPGVAAATTTDVCEKPLGLLRWAFSIAWWARGAAEAFTFRSYSKPRGLLKYCLANIDSPTHTHTHPALPLSVLQCSHANRSSFGVSTQTQCCTFPSIADWTTYNLEHQHKYCDTSMHAQARPSDSLWRSINTCEVRYYCWCANVA